MPCRPGGLLPCLLAVSILASLLTTRPAIGYTGGPHLCDVLGWDARAGRVWFHDIPANEAYEFGSVYALDVRDPRWSRRLRAVWDHPEAPANDSLLTQRVARLRSRLQRLPLLPADCLGWGAMVQRSDSLREAWGDVRQRYQLVLVPDEGHVVHATAFHKPDLCLKDVFAIPGRKERVYIVAFRGSRNDPAETQVPCIARGDAADTLHVRWPPAP